MAYILNSIKPAVETILIGSPTTTTYVETIVVTNIGVDTTFTIKQGINDNMPDQVMYLHYNDTILANETKYINLYITLTKGTYIWVSSVNTNVIFKTIG